MHTSGSGVCQSLERVTSWQLRVERGLSQERLADLADVSIGAVARLGATAHPGIATTSLGDHADRRSQAIYRYFGSFFNDAERGRARLPREKAATYQRERDLRGTNPRW